MSITIAFFIGVVAGIGIGLTAPGFWRWWRQDYGYRMSNEMRAEIERALKEYYRGRRQ